MPNHSGSSDNLFGLNTDERAAVAAAFGIGELAKALVRVQSGLKIAIKDKSNPFYKSKYADLQTVWETCRALLAENGIAVLQLPGGDGQTVKVTTMLIHSSGQWIADDGLAMTPVKQDPQGVASCITYARRYGLMAVLGIVSDEDDDGEAATRRTEPKAPQAVAESAPVKRGPQIVVRKPEPKQIEASTAAVPLLAGLTAIKVSGGWNAQSHKDNWKKKYQAQFDALDDEDKAEVQKAFLAVPVKAASKDEPIPF